MLRQNPLPATEFGGSPNHQKPVRNASRRDCERRIPGGILVHSGNTIAPRAASATRSPLTPVMLAFDGPNYQKHVMDPAAPLLLESGKRPSNIDHAVNMVATQSRRFSNPCGAETILNQGA